MRWDKEYTVKVPEVPAPCSADMEVVLSINLQDRRTVRRTTALVPIRVPSIYPKRKHKGELPAKARHSATLSPH